MHDQRKKEYEKKVNNRKLKRFSEYKSLYFSTGASAFIAMFLLTFSYDLTEDVFNTAMFLGAGIYFGQWLVQYVILKALERDIINKEDVSLQLRKCGFLCILFLAFGNIFAAISGFTIIKKSKNLEYTTLIYAFINSIAVIMVTYLNIFKEYVSNTFFLGIGVLAITSAFYLICMVLIVSWEKKGDYYSKMMPFAILLIISAITGNFFAILAGCVIISGYKSKGQDGSIQWIETLERLYRNNMALVGMLMIMFLVSISVTSLITFDYSLAVDNNYSAILKSISLEYPFGTDNFGRCVFTRIIFGAQISLTIGVCVTVVPLLLGGALGAFAGYYGNKTDNIIMRSLDVLYAVPSILLTIAIVAAFGAGTFNLVVAMSISSVAMYARTLRATVMGLSGVEFVEAARACGAKDKIIIFKHIIPNSLAPIIVRSTMEIGSAVLATSSLSYLGLGVEPHIPEWGNILKIGSKYLESYPHLAIFPGLAIILLVLAFNFFGDGLRDALDPKLK